MANAFAYSARGLRLWGEDQPRRILPRGVYARGFAIHLRVRGSSIPRDDVKEGDFWHSDILRYVTPALRRSMRCPEALNRAAAEQIGQAASSTITAFTSAARNRFFTTRCGWRKWYG